MATNDELMPDTREFETPNDGQRGVSEQVLENGQTFTNTQPLQDWPEVADMQSLAPVPSEQSAIADPDAEALAALKRLEEQRKKKRRNRIIAIIVICVIILALIGAWAATQMAAQSSQNESATATAVVKRADLTSSVQTTGNIKPASWVNVSAEVSGVIKDVMVTDGQNVKAGSVLFTLKNNDIDKAISEAQITLSRANRDLSEAQEDVSKAENDYAKAEDEYNAEVAEDRAAERKAVAHAEKVYKETYDAAIALIPKDATKQERKELTAEAEKTAQEMYDLTYLMESPGEIPEFDGSIYQISIDAAKSALVGTEEYVADLQRSYDSLLEEAEKRTVRAPVSGTVVDLLAEPGATVGFASGGTSTAKSVTLAKIADLSTISVDVEVSEVDISDVKAGQRAVLTFASAPGLELVGRVKSVATVASSVSDDTSNLSFSYAVTFKVTVVAETTDERLKPGMSTSVKILTKDIPNVLVVPAGAVEEDNGTSYVTVAKNDKATETERRAVVVSDRTSVEAAIASGLKEGEIVIDRSANASTSSESSSSTGTK